MNPHVENDRDHVEQLVREYLNYEASKVDGRAILERVRESRRRRAAHRRIAVAFATAAAVVIVVALGLLAAPGRPKHPDISQVISPIAASGSEMKDCFNTLHATLASLKPDIQQMSNTFRTPPMNGVRPSLAEFKTTLASDTAYVSGKLRTSIKNVVDRAGLTL